MMMTDTCRFRLKLEETREKKEFLCIFVQVTAGIRLYGPLLVGASLYGFHAGPCCNLTVTLKMICIITN